jgi:predicted RNA binding protein YcfA (HicA-like mRNA interferase family)
LKSQTSPYEADYRQGTAAAVERGSRALKRVKGSHHIFAKPGERKIIAVPVHGNQTIKPGLPLRIAKDAAISW